MVVDIKGERTADVMFGTWNIIVRSWSYSYFDFLKAAINNEINIYKASSSEKQLIIREVFRLKLKP